MEWQARPQTANFEARKARLRVHAGLFPMGTITTKKIAVDELGVVKGDQNYGKG